MHTQLQNTSLEISVLNEKHNDIQPNSNQELH